MLLFTSLISCKKQYSKYRTLPLILPSFWRDTELFVDKLESCLQLVKVKCRTLVLTGPNHEQKAYSVLDWLVLAVLAIGSYH